MKNKKYHKSQQLQKSNIKVLERGKIDTSTTWSLTFMAWYKHLNKKWQG